MFVLHDEFLKKNVDGLDCVLVYLYELVYKRWQVLVACIVKSKEIINNVKFILEIFFYERDWYVEQKYYREY